MNNSLKKITFAFAFFILLFAMTASAEAALSISPSLPTHGDTLTCSLNDGGNYIYEWNKNGVFFESGGGVSYTLSVPVSQSDTWNCKAFYPGNGQVPPYAGVSVTVDSKINGVTVAITPQNPNIQDSLSCTVNNGAGNYIFKWFKDGNLYQQDLSTSSTLSQTLAYGDDWTCKAYTPVNNFFVGEDLVLVDSLVQGTVEVTDSAVTGDTLDCVFSGGSGDYLLTWTKDSVYQSSTTVTNNGNFQSSDNTFRGQEWICNADTKLNGLFVDSDSVTIGNYVPVVSGIPDQTINEGETFVSVLLNNFVEDLDDSDNTIDWTYSGTNDLIISIINNVAIITIPNANWYGSEFITFTATDSQGATDFDNAWFEVINVNDAPFWDTPIEDAILDEDFGTVVHVQDLDDYTTDVDDFDSALSYSIVAEDTSEVNCAISIVGAIEDAIDLLDDSNLMMPVMASSSSSSSSSQTIGDVKLVLHSVQDWTGVASCTVRVQDPDGAFDDTQFHITVNSSNDGPVWSINIADTVLLEDFGSDLHVSNLRDLITDPDTEIIQFSVVSEDINKVNCEVDGNQLTLYSVLNWNGNTTCTIRAYDGESFADDTFDIEVLPVDDAPVVNNIPGQSICENENFQTFDLDSYLVEVDGDSIDWSYLGNTYLSVSIDSNNVVTVTPPGSNWVGSETIRFTATDVTTNALFNFDDAIFEVNNCGNDDPEWTTNISDVTLLEDFDPYTHVVDLNNNVFDADGDILTFSVVDETISEVNCQIEGDSLVLYSVLNWNGDTTCTIRVTDIFGGFADDTFNIKVLPVDDAPIVLDIPDQTIYQGDTFTSFDLDNYLVEVDGDAIVWTYSSTILSVLTVSIDSDNVVSITYPVAWFGSESITFTATDVTLAQLSDSDDAKYTVLKNNSNSDPEWVIEIPDVTLLEDFAPYTHVVNLSTMVFDADGDVLSFAVQNENTAEVNCEIQGESLVLYSVLNWNGATECTIRVLDTFGAFADDTFKITVLPVDDAPNVTGIPSQTICAGNSFTTFDLDDYLTEVDGDSIDWSYSNNVYLSISIDTNNLVTITYPNNWFSFESIKFTATDLTSNALFDSDIAIFKVDDCNGNNNTAPVWIIEIPDVTLLEDFAPYTHVVDLNDLVFDADGDVLSFAVQNENTAEVNCEIQGDSLVLYSVLNWNGITKCTIRVSDPDNAFADDTFEITVLPVDDVPNVTGIPDQSICIDENFHTFDLDDYLTEVDGDDVAWSYSGNSDLIVSINANGLVTITHPAYWLGSETITFKGTDVTLNQYFDVDSAVFTVQSCGNNDPVWTINISDVTLLEDFNPYTHVVDLNNNVFDADGDILTFSVVDETLSEVNCQIENNSLVLYSVLNWNGNTTCTIRVTDTFGAFADDTFNIEVLPVDDMPNVSGIPDQTICLGDSFTTFDLDDYLTEVDGDSVNWTYFSNGNFPVSIDSDNVVTVTPPTWVGSETITFQATDNTLNQLFSQDYTVFSTKDCGNNDPEWTTNISDVTLLEDFNPYTHVVDLNNNVFDADGDILTFSVVDETISEVNCQIENNSLVLYSVLNWNGNTTCTIRVTDTFGAFADDTFNIEVLPVDDMPVVYGIPNQTICFGDSFATFDLDDYLTEVDGDSINWTYISNGYLPVSIDSDNVVTVTSPSTYFISYETITFKATDETLNQLFAYGHTFFAIQDCGNNDPEWTTNISDVTLLEDFDPYTHVVNLSTMVFDADGDNLTFAVQDENLSEVNCQIENNSLVLYSVLNWNGNTTCTIRVTDTFGAFADDTFNIEVLPVDDMPNVSGIPDQTICSYDSFSTFDLDDYLTEVDGDLINWSYSNNSNLIVSIDANGLVTIAYNVNLLSSETITFKATDVTLNQYFDVDSATFTVQNCNNNTAPEWNLTIPDAYLLEDFGSVVHVIDLTTLVSDAENDNLTFTIVSENTSEVDCQLNGTTLILNSVLDWTGVASCTVSVSDGEFSTNDTFQIYVEEVTDDLIMDPIPDMVSTEDVPFMYQVMCYDPDGDIISFVDDIFIFDIGTYDGVISFTPVHSEIGVYQVTVTCSAGSKSVSDTFMLTVLPAPGRPIIQGADLIAYVGEPFSYQVIASDPDNDTLIYSDSTNLFNIDSNTGIISFVPTEPQLGLHNFVVYVYDGLYTSQAIFSIRIKERTQHICSDGVDNDNDGLTDYPEDPGCDSPLDNDEFNLNNNVEDGIKIVDTQIFGVDYNTVERGEYSLVGVTLSNYISHDFEDLTVGVMIVEYGVKEILGTVDVDAHGRAHVKSWVYIPDHVQPGDYYFSIFVSDSDLWRQKQIPVRII